MKWLFIEIKEKKHSCGSSKEIYAAI